MADGWLYDGITAVRRSVTIRRDADRVVIDEIGQGQTILSPEELTPADRRSDAVIYRRSGVDGWRLGIMPPVEAELSAILPIAGNYGRWIDRIGLWPAAAVATTISAAVLAIGFFAPAWLAPLVPPSIEKRYGDLLVGDFGGEFCTTPGGDAAIETLTQRLGNDDQGQAFDIRVVDISMVNAAALPGGHIVVFRGLIDKADNADEIAGVLAHEIAHVRNRHVTEALLRQFGFSMIIAGLGGSTAGNIDTMLSLNYSREAEREADLGAIATLAGAHVSPASTAAFFDRLAHDKDKDTSGRLDASLAYLSTHPPSADRRDVFTRSIDPKVRYQPALTEVQWQALQGICDPRRP